MLRLDRPEFKYIYRPLADKPLSCEGKIQSIRSKSERGGGGICKFENAFRSFVFFYLPGTPEKKKSVGTYIRIFTVNIVDYLCTVPSGIFGRE
jgi:hypothetical protein